MTQQHPVTVPPELVQQWLEQTDTFRFLVKQRHQYIADRAAQWGADQANADIESERQEAADEELEACCLYLVRCAQWEPEDVDELRAARRPKPPSLKEQALALVDECTDPEGDYLDDNALSTIRRALESIPDPS